VVVIAGFYPFLRNRWDFPLDRWKNTAERTPSLFRQSFLEAIAPSFPRLPALHQGYTILPI